MRDYKSQAAWWPPELIADLEEINFKNQIFWHRDQLLRLIGGDRGRDLFSQSERKRLKGYGIIRRVSVFEEQVYWVVTEKASSGLDLKPEISNSDLDLKPEM